MTRVRTSGMPLNLHGCRNEGSAVVSVVDFFCHVSFRGGGGNVQETSPYPHHERNSVSSKGLWEGTYYLPGLEGM